MDALLERLSPGQIVAVISIIAGAVVALAMIVAIAKYQFQALADDTALKREKWEAEVALREKSLEREAANGVTGAGELVAAGLGAPEVEKLNVQLATRFGSLGLDTDEIEPALKSALAADPARKKVIVEVMDELGGYHVSPEAILAAVRPLCAAASRRKPTPVPA